MFRARRLPPHHVRNCELGKAAYCTGAVIGGVPGVGGLIIIRGGLPPVDRGDETAEKIAEPYADQQGDQRLPAHDVGERRSLFLGHSGAGGGCLARLAPRVARQRSALLAQRVNLLTQRANLVLIRGVFPGHAYATFDEAPRCRT
jgi:hypothetical protein